MMTRMLGFCCCWADAGTLAAVSAAIEANKPSQIYLAIRMLDLLSAARDGPTACAQLLSHRLYIRLAAASARVHPARFPCASSRLARAKVAANVAFAFCS